ncbi:MAG: hypothetical protein DRP74_09330 [Candidatus Omnitrophota bacterium]|nr:MAG: hypothetical protein DRP74_09330 [Candidatus Omnitrophota bacterium]
MRAYLECNDGKSKIRMTLYTGKEFWKDGKCGIKGHKHKTPAEAFECHLKHHPRYKKYKILWLKE